MPVADKETADDFALKSMHLAKMTGVSVGTHAIGDGFLLMHTGVGCKYKAAAQVAQHDWARHPNRHEAWTQVGEVSLIRGSGQRIGPFARSWYERRRPGFMAVVSAYFIELTGEDIKDIVAETDGTLPCPMGVINTAAPNGGFFEGYGAVMQEVMSTLDWSVAPDLADHAATVGFFFHRYEPDQQADLAQLQALYRVAGLTPGPILFSGRNYAELAEAPRSRVVVRLPYSRPLRRKLRRWLKGREVVELDLPIGVSATSRFVRELTGAVGGDMARAEAWIDKQAAAVRPHLGHLAGGFQGLKVAVFADTPLAAGLVSLLRELGANVSLVGLRDRVLGGSAAFYETLERNGVALDPGSTLLTAPSLRTVRHEVGARVRAGELHAVIGSAIELNCIAWAPDVRGATQRVALLETGFPSKDHHTALALPTFGYTGALVWAQRLMDGILSPRLATRPLA